MSSPWGRCQVWHHAGHHQDRLQEIQDWILVPCGPSHHLCPHIRDRDKCHHDKLRDMQSGGGEQRSHHYQSVTWQCDILCHVKRDTCWVTIVIFKLTKHWEAPRAAISAFYHQHRQGELASDTEWRAQGFWGRCGSNSIKDCPLCFTTSILCQNHQNQINQYEPEHILRPHYSPYRAHVSGTLWSCD